MTYFLILVAVIILTCVLLNNATSKAGVPVLLAFIVLGMFFGNNGIFRIQFDDYEFAEKICSIALIFIMFYGGFGTNWKTARGIAVEAGLMATLGVFATAAVTGVFCHFLLHWDWIESLLMGSVISSTDAASVFSILRSKKLGLKNNTAPLLEVESGSNDPCSYMLTAIMISLLTTEVSAGRVVWMLFSQIVFGAGLGCLIAQGAVLLMKRIPFNTDGFGSLFVISIALFAYAIPQIIGGNGYLSVYIVGILLGNTNFNFKKDLVHFFDGFTSLMQILIFFLLGLLCHPAQFPNIIVPSLLIFLVLTLVSRPLSVLAVLAPFRKYSMNQLALVSFAGLRGAASIVFAIMATTGDIVPQHDILNIVFCIVLISISLQGTLLPHTAEKLGMIDRGSDVMKTFTDFSEETNMQFSNISIGEESPWKDRAVRELGIPKNILLCLVVHPDGSSVVPDGNTVLRCGDLVIMCTSAFSGEQYIHLIEHPLSKNSKWAGRMVKEYPKRPNEQLVLIKRNGENVIPHGSTVLMEGDILYINKGYSK